MKKISVIFFLLSFNIGFSQIINYNFTSASLAFAYNSAPTVLHAASVDDVMAASTAIGFTFQYGCVNYTTFQASSNGFLCLGTTAAGSNATNNLTSNTDRPIIAPLWDDLKTGTGGNVNYKLTGLVGARVLTVEWKQMQWYYSAASRAISFQIKLYEANSRIEFLYDNTGAAPTSASASIGLGGATSGDYYSLDGTGAAPLASKAVETTSLATKPANGQIYRWDPIACSGAPSTGTAAASPSVNCAAFTTTLSLTGSSLGCGLTYLWYQSSAAGGPYTAIGTATAVSTKTYAVTGTTYFQCVITCGVFSATSTVISASINPNNAGTGSYPISIPYTTTGQTTCGSVNDITSSNVTNICGSSLYYTGEDVVYIFTPTVTALINANVTSAGSYMGMNLYNGCPLGGGICVANAQSAAGNQSLGCAVTVSTGVTYYLVLDSYAAPACNPYDLALSLNSCLASPVSGTAVASPFVNCASYTTALSLTGAGSGCNVTYQWFQASAAGGPYSSIATATSVTTQTFAVTGTVYFKCVVSCGAFTSTTSVITASVNPSIIGTGSYPISIPYSTTGQTTCGFINDITPTNVTNICGSSSYYTGEDVVYVFTPTVTSVFGATVTSTGSSMGMTLYNGCPTGTGVCVANAQGAAGTENFAGPSTCPTAVTVTAGVTYYLIIDSYAAPTCNPYDLTITSTAVVASTVVACNMAYTASSTTYSFETISGTVLPTTDDVLFSSVVLFGFPVCFDGYSFNGGYVASNAAFVFDAVPCFPNIQTTTYAAGGASTGYSISGPAPTNSTSIPRNAILAPWHDINPALGGVIQYTVLGVAPNRRFVLSFENIPMYSCGTSSPTIYHSSQIKIFETSNNIEIHVRQKAVCPGWNNGQAVLGLHNYSGTIYTPPVSATAHNAKAATPYNQWTMTNTAYRFATTCGSSSSCGVTLPIGMKSFYGERVDKINNLYWETATEENLKKYKIQRSTDAINFTDIGEVTPNNAPSKYSFDDKNATAGVISYYRIATYENDGTYSYTSIVALGNGNNEILNASQIYPNPVNSSFLIALDSKQKGFATINVYDVFGRLVKSSDNDVNGGVTQYEIFVEDLKYGVYYVEVLNSFSEVISKQKFIKN